MICDFALAWGEWDFLRKCAGMAQACSFARASIGPDTLFVQCFTCTVHCRYFLPVGPPAPAGFPNSSEGAGAEDAGSGLVPPANFRKSAPEQHPVEKGPIPQEHKVLQEVFDGLRSRCVAAANHPVSRRVIIIRVNCVQCPYN